MTMRGVLIETEIRHENNAITKRVAQLTQCDLNDAIWVPGARPNVVLGFGNPKEDDSRNTEAYEIGNLGTKRTKGVLHDARNRCDRLWFCERRRRRSRR